MTAGCRSSQISLSLGLQFHRRVEEVEMITDSPSC